jgi:hypothetical protein
MPISFTVSVTCAQCGFGHHSTHPDPLFDPDDILESLLATVNYIEQKGEVFCSQHCCENWIRDHKKD